MSKSQIKFKNLTEDQTIQIIDLDDYFGDGIPKVTKPLTKLQFIKKHLQEIVDEEDVDVNEAFEMIDSDGDGDSNKVFVTVVDGEVKVILS
jgi:hypothetical protein